MITLTNGHVQNQAGLAVPNGSVTFQLNTDATIIASPFGIVPAEQIVTFQFDANGNILPNAPATAAKIYSNLELNPQNANGLGTYYQVTFYDANGARINLRPMWWQFPNPANSTVDISSVIPFATIGGNIIFYPTNFTIGPPGLSTLGGVFSNIGVAHQWIKSINTDGTVSLSQPAFADISGTISAAQLPPGLIPLWNTVVKTSGYTAAAGDEVLADTSAGGFTVSLPASSANRGLSIRVKKISSDVNTLTIQRSGSDTLDGQTSKSITSQYLGVDVTADGATNWWVLPIGAAIPAAGSNTQIQFNNAGVLGGASQAVYDTVNGVMTLTALGIAKTPLVVNQFSASQTAVVIAVTGDISIASNAGTGSLPTNGAIRFTKGSQILWRNNGGTGNNGLNFGVGQSTDPDVLGVIGDGVEASIVYADKNMVLNPTGVAVVGQDFRINQFANGDDCNYWVRKTDSSPTGSFLRFRNAADATDLFKVDIAGNLTIPSGQATVTGPSGFATTGIIFATAIATSGGSANAVSGLFSTSGAGSIGLGAAGNFVATHSATGTLVNMQAVNAQIKETTGAGTLTEGDSLLVLTPSYATGATPTNYYGLRIQDSQDAGGRSATNNWGIRIDAQSPTSNTFALDIAGGKTTMTPNAVGDVALRVKKFSASQTAAAAEFDVMVQLDGLTSGSAQLGVASVAGTPNRLNLPTATAGAANQVLTSDAGSPQQASWQSNVGLLLPATAGFKEDFLAESLTTGTVSVATAGTAFVADTGWFLKGFGAAGTWAAGGSFANPGQLSVITGATSGNGVALVKGYTNSSKGTLGGIGGNAGWESHFIFSLGATTNIAVRLGFFSAGAEVSDPPTDGIWVRYDTAAADTNFTFETRAASASTVSASTVAADTNFHHVRIRSTIAGTILFQIDGGTEISINTNAPSSGTALGVVLQALTRTAAGATATYDYASYFVNTGRT